MASLNYDRMYTNLKVREQASGRSSVVATIHDFEVIGKVARVLASFSSLYPNPDDTRHAISAALDNKLTPIEGSFREMSDDNSAYSIMSGFVTTNRPVRNFSNKEIANGHFREIAENILMDNNDKSFWDVKRGTSGNKYISRRLSEDISELLEEARVIDVRKPNLAPVTASTWDIMEFCSFVDPDIADVRYGYIAANEGSLAVVPSDDANNILHIDRRLVIESRLNPKLPPDFDVEETASYDASKMIAYIKKIYAYAPAYANKYVEQIRRHASI